MNVEIGAEAALFPEKEYINAIAVAVQVCVVHVSKTFFQVLFILQICTGAVNYHLEQTFSYFTDHWGNGSSSILQTFCAEIGPHFLAVLPDLQGREKSWLSEGNWNQGYIRTFCLKESPLNLQYNSFATVNLHGEGGEGQSET